MVLISSPEHRKPESAGHPAPQREQLGRVAFTAKSAMANAAGAMRFGLQAHLAKACANLCIISGSALCSHRKTVRSTRSILAGENGGPVPGEFLIAGILDYCSKAMLSLGRCDHLSSRELNQMNRPTPDGSGASGAFKTAVGQPKQVTQSRTKLTIRLAVLGHATYASAFRP